MEVYLHSFLFETLIIFIVIIPSSENPTGLELRPDTFRVMVAWPVVKYNFASTVFVALLPQIDTIVEVF